MAFDTLTIRAYNVRFGDAFLISVPDSRGPDDPPAPPGQPADTIMRHILVDVGNAFAGSGGDDDIFVPIVRDILDVLDGAPVDLYIMTHEHMDHIQGLLAAERKTRDGEKLTVKARFAWLTASAAPDYYERDWGDADMPKRDLTPPQQRNAMEQAYDDAARFISALRASGETPSPLLMSMLHINNYRSSKDCVDYLRQRAPDATAYVHREFPDLEQTHPFQRVRLELWAPEENTAVYYGQLRPRTVASSAAEDGAPAPVRPIPPPGVDAAAFYRLVNARENNIFENLLAIDKAKNNSSIVFFLEWAGWRFLFPGDAQTKSWQIMEDKGLLKPVHFLKISHHLSHNGTPEGETLEKILPQEPTDGRQRLAVASTYPFTYNGIPFEDIIERLQGRDVITHIIGAALGDFPDNEEEKIPYRPGYLRFTYPEDGSEPLVAKVMLDGDAAPS